MTPEVRTRLLASLQANRLAILCGAGLSMADPSNLPSAQHISEHCFDEYQRSVDPHLDLALRSDLEALAEHFRNTRMLETTFIGRLVPWDQFAQPYNLGHAAMADFLIVRAVSACVSSNFDILIERCAWDYGFDFQAALDGDEATGHATTQSPLIKIHGCSNRDRINTIWAPTQIRKNEIARRIERSKVWLESNLRNKDILVIGFWSDWAYLNQIIGSALNGISPSSVILVDPADDAELQQRAPDLWEIAHGENVCFSHVNESGADVLDELRRAYSINYLSAVMETGRQTFEQQLGESYEEVPREIADFGAATLYRWRQDAEGVPDGKPATRMRPENTAICGFFHLLLRRSGARQVPEGYELNERTIRVINGAGESLSSLRNRFIEAPVKKQGDIVVAAGATDLGLPGDLIDRGREGNIIRPRAGGRWMDLVSAREELGI